MARLRYVPAMRSEGVIRTEIPTSSSGLELSLNAVELSEENCEIRDTFGIYNAVRLFLPAPPETSVLPATTQFPDQPEGADVDRTLT
ncbi:hypothetical protein T265_02961 [Opisthorchis viverrini]|uniref:Uncharacterized protein n=1 Tax=Opisthorchis viverrini TaxID=6198 RepID=A0A074ZU24_OPIVI|nr:hypothetical protein T265_02961 [Opisthorchis viverrini]KER30606.1 hypothetical protein T265_02961 [Opisthorchis viverrini]